MAGLLGQGWDDPQSAAIMALAGGLLRKDFGGGLLAANQAVTDSRANALKMRLLNAQIGETEAQGQERSIRARREQEALEQATRLREAIPSLFQSGAPGVPGEGGPSPTGVYPPTPGFDVQRAIALGMDPKMIQEYAGLQNVNRPKATRQMEVDDGKGGKRIALVDDYGREVAGFAGYTAPVQVNQGDRVSFVRPAPGVSLGVNMSPDAKASNALGWANHGISKQRLALDSGNALADGGGVNQIGLQRQFGKPEPGYRWKPDGSQEAIPGGSKDIKAGIEGQKLDQKRAGTLQGAENVIKEIQDARKLVGVTTAGVGGFLKNVPATDARDLSAKLETVKANLGFDRLQQMRDQSPTGGALGAVAVQELVALQSTVASLDQMQSPSQLNTALAKIEHHYKRWADTVRQAGSGQGGATGSFGPPGGGWSIQKVN